MKWFNCIIYLSSFRRSKEQNTKKNLHLILILFNTITYTFKLHFIDSNHIHFWRRNEQYDNKIIANQFNITEEPLQAQSVTSCGRLCSNLRRSPAFSYMETFCYMYNSKPTDSDIFTTLGGAVYYSEEPNAKSISNSIFDIHTSIFYSVINFDYLLSLMEWVIVDNHTHFSVLLDGVEEQESFSLLMNWKSYFRVCEQNVHIPGWCRSLRPSLLWLEELHGRCREMSIRRRSSHYVRHHWKTTCLVDICSPKEYVNLMQLKPKKYCFVF